MHRYRIALLSTTGKILVASEALTSTGSATVPLARVMTTLPPSIGTVTRTIGGQQYPMLWRWDHADPELSTSPLYLIEEDRCRSVRLATVLQRDGVPGTTLTAWMRVGWASAAHTFQVADAFARVTVTDGTATATGTVTSVGRDARSQGQYSLRPTSWSYSGLLGSPADGSGEALFGGVGLCSRVVR